MAAFWKRRAIVTTSLQVALEQSAARGGELSSAARDHGPRPDEILHRDSEAERDLGEYSLGPRHGCRARRRPGVGEECDAFAGALCEGADLLGERIEPPLVHLTENFRANAPRPRGLVQAQGVRGLEQQCAQLRLELRLRSRDLCREGALLVARQRRALDELAEIHRDGVEIVAARRLLGCFFAILGRNPRIVVGFLVRRCFHKSSSSPVPSFQWAGPSALKSVRRSFRMRARM